MVCSRNDVAIKAMTKLMFISNCDGDSGRATSHQSEALSTRAGVMFPCAWRGADFSRRPRGGGDPYAAAGVISPEPKLLGALLASVQLGNEHRGYGSPPSRGRRLRILSPRLQ